jgi:hypothetical protein
MPGGNRTGPFGEGPKTGKGLGFCSEQELSGSKDPDNNVSFGYGRGWRNRWGKGRIHQFGHGFDRFPIPASTGVSEMTLLENEARVLKEQLATIEKRLSDLKKKAD